MYHGIIKSHSKNPLKNIYGYHISEEQFRNQMEYLSKHCNVLKVSEAIAGEKFSPHKKNVVITFDDGYRNNYTNAFKILSKYNLPALFAIPTDFVINRVPLWPDVIEYAVVTTVKKLARIKWEDRYLDIKLNSVTEKIKFIKWLLSACVEVAQEKREQFISHVLEELGVFLDNDKILKNPDYEPLTPQEIKTMAESKLAEFASHSVHHYVLSRINKDTLINELTKSKLAIEQMTGLPCKYFCIPGGFYNDQIINAILEAEFEKVFTSEYSEFHPTNKPDIIGRYCITKNINMALFTDIIQGPFHRIYYSLISRK
jgi:peptidoglycan/xylan/chitin deacetylase (PgdA/CDA1 family)